jgi:hypothetical protein
MIALVKELATEPQESVPVMKDLREIIVQVLFFLLWPIISLLSNLYKQKHELWTYYFQIKCVCPNVKPQKNVTKQLEYADVNLDLKEIPVKVSNHIFFNCRGFSFKKKKVDV